MQNAHQVQAREIDKTILAPFIYSRMSGNGYTL